MRPLQSSCIFWATSEGGGVTWLKARVSQRTLAAGHVSFRRQRAKSTQATPCNTCRLPYIATTFISHCVPSFPASDVYRSGVAQSGKSLGTCTAQTRPRPAQPHHGTSSSECRTSTYTSQAGNTKHLVAGPIRNSAQAAVGRGRP